MATDPERLRRLMTPEWTPARERAVWRAMERARVRRRRRGWMLGAAGGVAIAAAALLWLRPTDAPAPVSDPAVAVADERPATVQAPTPPQGPAPLEFRDGTQVRPHDAQSEVVIAEAGPERARLLLRRGGARFDVVPNPDRRFSVDVGPVTVEVLGTEFDLDREGDRVHVQVIRGTVAVSWSGGREVLTKGEQGVFPPEGAPAVPQKPGTDVEPTEAVEPVEAVVAPRPTKRPKHDVEALLDAADAARRAGKSDRALSILQRVVREHRRDPRAPLAAFTMGRIEQARGHHKSAARHFARVRTLGKNSLSEHALAREVEALDASGQRGKAQVRAQEYLRKHPKGPRAAQVRRVLP